MDYPFPDTARAFRLVPLEVGILEHTLISFCPLPFDCGRSWAPGHVVSRSPGAPESRKSLGYYAAAVTGLENPRPRSALGSSCGHDPLWLFSDSLLFTGFRRWGACQISGEGDKLHVTGGGELGVFREFSWVPCPSSGKEEAGQGIRKPGLKVMP